MSSLTQKIRIFNFRRIIIRDCNLQIESCASTCAVYCIGYCDTISHFRTNDAATGYFQSDGLILQLDRSIHVKRMKLKYDAARIIDENARLISRSRKSGSLNFSRKGG